ncbi:hypothetical protein QFC19_001709 [Naganishia cerealis]|uniref:Uncharacterized protein n=1 Tax=Naganishia cerealis TaxID=610337 RepID=A0ACC2WHK2_9TREE|nr:hypothetical protein QFC19_001709 [Naganishia cerealis]
MRLEVQPLAIESRDVVQRILSVADALQASGLHPQHPPRLYASLLRRLVGSRAQELQQQQRKTYLMNAMQDNANNLTSISQPSSAGPAKQMDQRSNWIPQGDFALSAPRDITLAPAVDLTMPSRNQSPGYNKLPV